MVGLETSNNNSIVLVVILAIVVIGLALILMRKVYSSIINWSYRLGLGLTLTLMRKVYTSSQDKKEFAKFKKEQMITELDTGESQISEQVMSKDDPSLDNVQIRS